MHRNWLDLIKPKGIEVEELSEYYGRFIAKPLERGYGVTIGNSIRRILLSSINGAAIVGVKIYGVEHEFTTLEGVKEDISDIILNLKQVNVSYLGEEPITLYLSVEEEKVVCAEDIKTDGRVKILNPKQVIATLAKSSKLEMELMIKHGRGYVTAEENRQDNFPVGMIAIDAMFAPVRKVAYNLARTRVGQITNYDKLTLEIWTNGAIRPDDALGYSAKILKNQLSMFINFDESEEIEEPEEIEEKVSVLNEHLFKSVDTLELSVRAGNCLKNAGIKWIGELVTKTESEMLKTKNFGRKSLNEIKEILIEMGLHLNMKIEGFDLSMLKEQQPEENENFLTENN